MVNASLSWIQSRLKAKILEQYAAQYKILSVILVTLDFKEI